MPVCTCPVGTEITDLTAITCPEYIGQIQKLIFQRRYSTGTTENIFTIGSTNPNLGATWLTVLDASDGTKAVITPIVDNPQNEVGESTTEGGGNASVGGVVRILNRTATKFTFELINWPQDTIKELKLLSCEALSFYMVNNSGGQIIGKDDGLATPLVFKGIPIQVSTMDVTDKSIGGLDASDRNILTFSTDADWSDDLHVVTPTDFDGRDLAPS